jgi:hypothetical protein
MSLESTPAALRDLYAKLSREDKDAFLKLIASTAREPVMMVSALSALEQEKFTNQQCAAAVNIMMPPIVEYAIEQAILFVRQKPNVTDDEIREHLRSKREAWTNDAAKVVVERERERIKKARDPKPRQIERTDEIVRLRDVEGKTFGEIGRILIQKNAKWCGKGGKPMTRDAVEKAYHRRKAVPTK